MNCFARSVSPLKNTGKARYFDMKLQTGETVVRGVCFSPDKKKQLDDVMNSHKPVTLTNYEISKKFDITSVVINKQSKVAPCSEPVNFDRIDIEKATLKLSAVNTIMPGQLVNIKATAREITGTKLISKTNGEKLKKQETMLVDPFGSIKMILWENFVDSIERHATYLFKNLRLKKDHYNNEVYVNTAMSGTEILPALDFDLPLQEDSTTQLGDFGQTSVTAEIIGISHLSSHYTCRACIGELKIEVILESVFPVI